MKRRLIPILIALLCGPGLLLAQKDKTKQKDPTLVIRLQSLDDLVGNFRYLAAQAGRENEAKQLEIIFKAFTEGNGLEGLSTKKPMGLYGALGSDIVDSEVVLMIPVADEKAVLAAIKRFGFQVDKDKKDIYTVAPKVSPVPIHFTFSKGYVYATAQSKLPLDRDRRLSPEKVLPADKVGVFSLSLKLSDLPNEIRQLINGQLARELSDLSEKREGESKAEQELRKETLNQFAQQVKIFLDGAGKLSIKLDIDQKAGKLKAEYELGAKPDSELAKAFKELGGLKSTVAGIISESAMMSGSVRLDLPKWYSQGLQKIFSYLKKPAVQHARNEITKKYAKALMEALEPVSKMKEIDLAFNMSGPNAKGLYTVVGGARVNKATGIEKVIRMAMKDEQIPQEIKDHLSLDVFKAGQAQIHRVNITDELDPDTRRVFGKSPLYLAFRENEIFFAMGADAETAIKSAVTAKPVESAPTRFTVSVSRLAPLIEQEHKGAIKAAEKIFGKNGQHDRITYSITGGASLKAEFSMDVKLFRFFAELGKKKTEE